MVGLTFFKVTSKIIFAGRDKIFQGNATSLLDIIRDGNATVTRTGVSVKLPGLIYIYIYMKVSMSAFEIKYIYTIKNTFLYYNISTQCVSLSSKIAYTRV